MAKALQGVMAALLTPFDHQQQLDSESLRRLVRFNIGQGIDGLYVGGSTGKHSYRALLKESRYWRLSPKRRRENHVDRPCRDGKHRRKPAACQRRKALRF